MGRRALFAILATLVLAPLLWAAYHRIREREAAQELLRAVATAHQGVSYEGEGARGNEWPGTWVIHDAVSGRTRYGSGPWSHVESAPDCRMPDPAAFCLDLEALLENYRASEGPHTRLLDRDAGTLVVEPRIEGRPKLEIAYDRATLLPLRVRTFRFDGSLLRDATFHTIFLGKKQVVEGLDPMCGVKGRSVAPAEVESALGFRVATPAYLPDGFRLLDCRVSETMGPCVKLLYTDGATAFELLERPVLLPAQMEIYFSRAPPGPFGPDFQRKDYVRRGRRAVIRSGGAGSDGVAVERHECGAHVRYELRVSNMDLTLCGRADIDPEEHLRVLRSLVVPAPGAP